MSGDVQQMQATKDLFSSARPRSCWR